MASINHDFGLPAFSIEQRFSSATRSSITSTQARSGFWDLRVSQGALPLEGCQPGSTTFGNPSASYKISNKVSMLDEGWHIPILNANRAFINFFKKVNEHPDP